MLECKEYTKQELLEILDSTSRQSLERKLFRYGIEFEGRGYANDRIYKITQIQFPFKLFCILDLDVGAQTDFIKLRNFYYYYFNDNEFMAMPNEVKERRMREQGRPLTRQTIATYTRYLENKDLIYRNTEEFIYYFAYKDKQIITEKDVYNKAWHEYWMHLDAGLYPIEAINRMRADYGGVARKQAVPTLNAFYLEKIEYLISLVMESINEDLVRQLTE